MQGVGLGLREAGACKEEEAPHVFEGHYPFFRVGLLPDKRVEFLCCSPLACVLS